MNYSKNNNYMDRYIWRCKKTDANNHDIKVNIRKNSIIENSKADIKMVYFIVFYNFALNISIYKAFHNSKKEFAEDI